MLDSGAGGNCVSFPECSTGIGRAARVGWLQQLGADAESQDCVVVPPLERHLLKRKRFCEKGGVEELAPLAGRSGL